MRMLLLGLTLLTLLTAAAGCALPSSTTARWDHIVVVVLENRSASQVRDLPYLKSLRTMGREFTAAYGVARPSQPNYFALFSGSTQGVADNNLHDVRADNLGTRLEAAGLRMVSWAQSLGPVAGFRGELYPYLRKHNPAASFVTVPDRAIRDFSEFPADYATLPEVSFVVPDMVHDMHDDTPAHSDAWLATVLPGYVAWARSHRSLLIVTFDEPDTALGVDVASTPIYTVFVGQGIPPSTDPRPVNLYGLLKYLLDAFGLPPLGYDAQQPALDDGRP